MDGFHFFLVVLKVEERGTRDELWHSQGGGQVGNPRKFPKVLHELSSKIGAILLCVNHRIGKPSVAEQACVLGCAVYSRKGST